MHMAAMPRQCMGMLGKSANTALADPQKLHVGLQSLQGQGLLQSI